MKKQIKTMEQLKDSRLLYEKQLPAFGYMMIILVSILLIAVVFWSIWAPRTYIINSTGTVQSKNKNYVMAPFTGVITKINIEEGKVVEKGDELLTIKSTDLDIQSKQLEEQKNTYKTQIAQYKKLVKSIQDDTNYFDASNSNDTLYFSQYETYKSQVKQQKVDPNTYKAYNYTQEQIEQEFLKNQSKIEELYHSAIKAAEDSIQQAQTQLDSIDAQLGAVGSGKENYVVIANATGKIHMASEYKKGMVVQAAASVASIASEQDNFTIQIFVEPSDAARVAVGNKVDIAVSGLAQSVYGTISGRVTQKDSDITTQQGESEGKSASYFKMEITPDYCYLISKDGDKVNLSNGMAVQARIQYDKVTYFNYVLEELGVLTR
ncbi:HlyD family secretion protein [Anaerosacchariphilus polymeriproducens]|uniref:HlyD family efflux transporter periplasmic adaptor subunit n=1 Tax=Anaerosacchariphilus polymeriproducens TaxID=1812858 RepID=A0A371AQN0_9FIRM|nr:HlyD family efflux transporter periplasmic adaptor subunit [Anaerosacchariphilus polymeriproducens]RDU21883.1 HlyD family efflux transporter periplasmic adaptor subunit [Anaerosacchariphilus polymeriproducens]